MWQTGCDSPLTKNLILLWLILVKKMEREREKEGATEAVENGGSMWAIRPGETSRENKRMKWKGKLIVNSVWGNDGNSHVKPNVLKHCSDGVWPLHGGGAAAVLLAQLGWGRAASRAAVWAHAGPALVYLHHRLIPHEQRYKERQSINY